MTSENMTSINRPSLKGKRVLVLGLGISGRAAAGYLLRRGALVTAFDKNHTLIESNHEIFDFLEKGMSIASKNVEITKKNFDLVVVSPGIPHSDLLYIKAKESGIEIIGEVELAFRYLTNPVLGITGTNGKTTVTLLVTHILNASGLRASALGNSGVALTSEEAEKEILSDSIVVAELSSFQLETMNSKILDEVVLLNVTPDHLDRYNDMTAYALAKIHISNCLKPNGNLFIEQTCFEEYGRFLQKDLAKLYGYSPDCYIFTDLKSIYVQGKLECNLPANYAGKRSHELENLMAAYALCRAMGVTPKQCMDAVSTFKKPSHRIEFVRELNGVMYFDDSKGTNLDAVVKAVETMPGKVILIAGGVDKGAPYDPWISAFGEKVRCVCAIGQASPKISQDISHAIPVHQFNTLQEAVKYAAKIAQKGDNVLLSPGCSSFDMFKDYAHRGEEFQRTVKELNTV